MFQTVSNHLHHFILIGFFFVFLHFVVELSLLHDQVVDFKLACCSFHYLLFNRAFGHKPVHNHVFRLSNTMRSSDSLEVNLRIPVRIKNNHETCGMKVNANAPRSRRQNENLLIWLWILKLINSLISISCWRLPIYPAILVASYPEHIINDVHAPYHLTKDQHFWVLNQFGQKMIKYLELHRSVNYVVSIHLNTVVLKLNPTEYVGVIAHFSELH